ncbi:FAD-dependent oxidoreductase [Methylovirgula sp. 4M-Z18]|uniref:FAD-dependent oxidoreductase n=1 Tax=Methylovirgula sp. 4M-Z18 TaxID=2293567 RepID=UPI000E2F8AFE|nr:FAD-dependent oxidoreductase [Methylovirgula sp. 4M-Z18]RFB79074.1 FAD-dependent oxidoreductase [Methylovirgula sp. 4M-Z18]
MRVRINGAGIAGLTCAYEFARRGARVEIIDQRDEAGRGCSWFAGGMIAPWCEAESAEPLVLRLGQEALRFWAEHFPVARKGTLVVAPPRDRHELDRFARRTSAYEWVDADAIAAHEPDLGGRFSRGLFFHEEAHLDPRATVDALVRRLAGEMGVTFRLNENADFSGAGVDVTLDCRGLAARDVWPSLRGVKGEMVIVKARDVTLSRPVRLLHPRIPVYIVPRAGNLFMIGATMIENDEAGRITARSLIELLNAAYTLHPAFGEAEVVEIGCDVRPAFPDNLPRIRRDGRIIRVNGLYRHGYLLSPSIARMTADLAFEDKIYPEVMHEDFSERATA